MSTVVDPVVFVDEWRGLYSESWKGVIVDEAFAHPAKFSRALIRKIYDHVIAEGWATKGSSVVDPFGGVALGGFDAMRHGLNWTGCELEEKFVELGGKNIALWNERYSRMPNWGTARLIQGDSRKLVGVLSAAECCVSSPPYTGNALANASEYADPAKAADDAGREIMRAKAGAAADMRYGSSEGQLGAMKEGDHSIAISSPPYIESLKPETEEQTRRKQERIARSKTLYDGRKLEKPSPGKAGLGGGYGITEGNVAAMPEGDLCVTSPPFESTDTKPTRMGSGRPSRASGDGAGRNKGDYHFSTDEANLGNMRGGFEAAVSSPPYEGIQVGTGSDERKGWRGMTDHAGGTYANEAQLSAQPPETFWSASRLILEQLHQVLAPNAHAVFVVKSFVRNKKIVDFPAQWAQLCEAVGFKLLHEHHALLMEEHGKQDTLTGEGERAQRTVARKSFFRRLAESKGSPRIDHESVLCFEKV